MSSSHELHAALGQESSVVEHLRHSLEEEVKRREEAERNVRAFFPNRPPGADFVAAVAGPTESDGGVAAAADR